MLLASCSSGGSSSGGNNSGGSSGGGGGGTFSNFNIELNTTNDNGTISLSATITNNSNATIDSVLLDLRRNDKTLVTADIGTLLPKSLPSATTDITKFATSDTPETFGNYAYRVCVRDASSSSITCSRTKTFALFPDLTVSLSAKPDAANPNTDFALIAEITNIGTRFSTPATLKFQRSTTDNFSNDATSDNIASLAANAITNYSLTINEAEEGIYYYKACVQDVTGESNSTNNCSMIMVEINNIVLAATNDNGTITLTTTIINNSGAAINSALVEFYRNDNIIATNDIGTLLQGARNSRTIKDRPTMPGNYIYQTCLRDITTDKAFCSPERAFALFPDLAVTFTTSATRVYPNRDVTLTAEITNLGKRFAPPTILRFQRSTSPNFSNDATSENIAELSVNATTNNSFQLNESVAGIYYYRACVQDVTGDSNPANNCSVLQVEVIPIDLSIELTATNNNGTIRLSAAITNENNIPLESIELIFKRDATTFPTIYIDNLAANGNRTEAINNTPTTPGNYAYKVCVRDASSSSITCSRTKTFALFPNLATTFSTSAARVYPKRDFTLNAEITNRGTRFSPPTTLRIQRSTTDSFSTDVTSDNIASLSVDAITNHSITTNESELGNYTYNACVDSVTGDPNPANDCSEVQVTIIPVNLGVILATSSDNGEIGLSATITNEDITIDSIVLEFRRNNGFLKRFNIDNIGLGENILFKATSDTPTTAGTYIYTACVIDALSESEVCSPEEDFTFRPDLIVSLSSSLIDVNPSTDFTLTAEITNTGNIFSTFATLEYERSTQAGNFTANDDTFDATDIAGITVNTTIKNSITRSEKTEDTYYYRACVRNVAGEQETTNNCSPAISVEIMAVPDLIISQFTVSSTDTQAGSNLTLSALVENIGLSDAPSTFIKYYRSNDQQISPTNDELLITDNVPEILVKATTNASAVAGRALGTFYYGVCLERAHIREDITNNCSSGVIVNTFQLNWQRQADANWSERLGHSSLVYDNKMWVLGGSNKDDVWNSINGINWHRTTKNANWTIREDHTSLVYDNKMWVLGGNYSGSYENDVWDSTNGIIWYEVTDAAGWSGRHNHTSLVYDNKMWVLGGQVAGAIYKNDVWFSTNGIQWQQATGGANWSARSNHTSLVYDNKMWVLGGNDSSNKNDVWYSTDGVNWQQAAADAGWSARRRHTSLVYDNKMWVIGGWDGTTRNNNVWFSENGIKWFQTTTSNSIWSERYNHTSLSYDNKMWVIGGNDGNNQDDVWSASAGGDSTASALELALYTQTSSVLQAGEKEYYYFTLPAGSFRIAVNGSADTLCELYTRNENLITESGNAGNCSLTFDNIATKDFFVLVKLADTDATGDYNLRIFPNTPDLSIASLSASPTPIYKGNNIEITAKVQNIGYLNATTTRGPLLPNQKFSNRHSQ